MEFFQDHKFTVLGSIKSNEYLKNYLEQTLIAPLDEFLRRPSKGIRAELVKIGYRTCTLQPESPTLNTLCQIIEAIHSGSLIVDDIQDNSSERRDGPSFHVLQGLPRALNAGNWLYFWALKCIQDLDSEANQKQQLISAFHHMLYEGHIGQAFDLGKPISEVPLNEISRLCQTTMELKTGSLTGLALQCGGLLANGDSNLIQELASLGSEFGVLLQSLDDIKNIKPQNEIKTSGLYKAFEDLTNQRPSFVWAFAAEQGEQCFADLNVAVSKLPNLDEFFEWQNKYELQQVILHRIVFKFEHLLALVNETSKRYKLDLTLKNNFEKLFTKLKESYEKT